MSTKDLITKKTNPKKASKHECDKCHNLVGSLYLDYELKAWLCYNCRYGNKHNSNG